MDFLRDTCARPPFERRRAGFCTRESLAIEVDVPPAGARYRRNRRGARPQSGRDTSGECPVFSGRE